VGLTEHRLVVRGSQAESETGKFHERRAGVMGRLQDRDRALLTPDPLSAA
jgi:hypothetical protein